ncbi:MAG: hypothetical protein ACR2QF_14190 [Geminicoccaceae bacterium]
MASNPGMGGKRMWFFAILMVFLLGHPGHASDSVFENFPDLILCKTPKGTIVLYLDQVFDEGSAHYRGLGGGIAQLDANGVLHRENQPDCDGETLEQLRDEGKARTFSNLKLEGETRP